jgi:hypothetical protein
MMVINFLMSSPFDEIDAGRAKNVVELHQAAVRCHTGCQQELPARKTSRNARRKLSYSQYRLREGWS